MRFNTFNITKYNHWWNINLFIYDNPGSFPPYGKSYDLTWFIPQRVKVWLANRSRH